jgi:hypothetical protein
MRHTKERLRESSGKFFLKGSMTRDFIVQIFSLIGFPRALEYIIGVIANVYENSWRYS